MRHAVLALAALGTTLAAAPAGAEPLVLQPYGPWNVDFGEDSCRLQRLFGSAEDKHVLMFQQYWPDARAGLTVAGPAIARFRTRESTQISYLDGQAPVQATGYLGDMGDYGRALIFSNVAVEAPDARREADDEAADGGLRQIDPGFGKQVRYVAVKQCAREVRFATGAMDAAFKVLNQCTLEQVRGMGLDVDKYVTMRSRPRWLNQAALTRRIVAQYPREALLQGEQGIMRMRVIVGADGTVERCDILKATATQRLESPACAVMRNAEFEPARDADGKPFRSLYATSILYKTR